MDSIDLLQKFNTTFLEFADDIIKVVPHDGEFRMYSMAMRAAIMINERIIHDNFYAHVTVPYGDRILARDSSFFLTHDYQDVKGEHQEAEAIIDKVKTYWADLKEDDRDTIWKYFRVMVLLSRKIHA